MVDIHIVLYKGQGYGANLLNIPLEVEKLRIFFFKSVYSEKKMEGKGSPKREFKQLRSRNQKILRSNLLEAISQANNNNGGVVSHINEDGAVRVKIVVRKQDLKQMLGIINGGGGGGGRKASANYLPTLPSSSVEERLNLLRRKHVLRSPAIKKSRRHCWCPELQSIPEE